MDKLLDGLSILVVEDEMLLVMTIEDILADLGCRSISVAATIATALALIEGQAFDAAMLDINLKGTNSRHVAGALAARDVPFFFSTGNTVGGIDGFNDRAVLRKPFNDQQLRIMFAHLLSHSSRFTS